MIEYITKQNQLHLTYTSDIETIGSIYKYNLQRQYQAGLPYMRNVPSTHKILLNMCLGRTHHKERESTSQYKGGSTLKPYGNKGSNPFAL